jgi:hypothetical protein
VDFAASGGDPGDGADAGHAEHEDLIDATRGLDKDTENREGKEL